MWDAFLLRRTRRDLLCIEFVQSTLELPFRFIRGGYLINPFLRQIQERRSNVRVGRSARQFHRVCGSSSQPLPMIIHDSVPARPADRADACSHQFL